MASFLRKNKLEINLKMFAILGLGESFTGGLRKYSANPFTDHFSAKL